MNVIMIMRLDCSCFRCVIRTPADPVTKSRVLYAGIGDVGVPEMLSVVLTSLCSALFEVSILLARLLRFSALSRSLALEVDLPTVNLLPVSW
jgi:hypothetical protein